MSRSVFENTTSLFILRLILIWMPRKRRERTSIGWLYIRLFEYMFYNSSEKQGFTKYELMTKVLGLPSQRQDRISKVIDKMVEKGHLKVVFDAGPSGPTYYDISDEGRKWYETYGREIRHWLKDIYEK